MLEIKVFGGLGNQMFQYAFFRYLEQKNSDIVLNISDYKVHNHHQGFELERIFGLSGPYSATESELAAKSNSVAIRMLQKALNLRCVKATEYYEHKEISFIPQTQINSDTYFVGFWQDIRYIQPIEDQLKIDFRFKPMDNKNKEFIEVFSDKETVSIHVRRGDYVKNRGLGGICCEDYYKYAIEAIKGHVVEPIFIFFSDDIDWCKKTLTDLDAQFVDWNIGKNSFRDMQLMSCCKHNIIANSTFSWWGAFLNPNENKIVVLPKIWNDKYKLNRLAYPEWKTV